ncbi:hypothetical protein CBM2615_B70209 [Cupriavidus taiwanensis]|uniref:ChrB C-terminal domain-containing protein n=1 Tax=Cupriavidus taiwanensis TaxID=164546 RepID=A0A976G5Q7_9BURK|nr:hypothetical protein CBM2614_B70114 [Cupriavidus taiwanensis]SOZ70332.1 hypothetical protein CBM2615_B70209 [Cupriavidus taiwanensis]SOZ73236.1 hypothetical protein CBM2613_B50342 [Cupriavidus taiwanensis]SPA10103.1 hypothetical protein CBM2625_B60258 [Cupriavidus taiwanensis]
MPTRLAKFTCSFNRPAPPEAPFPTPPKKNCESALGFDFDGATFTHVGDRVSFEVLLASFGLEANRGLSRLARMVHALDIGGVRSSMAPPLLALVTVALLLKSP